MEEFCNQIASLFQFEEDIRTSCVCQLIDKSECPSGPLDLIIYYVNLNNEAVAVA